MQLTLSCSEIFNSRFNTAFNKIPPKSLPAELLATTHVLVHWDSHVPPSEPLYNSPYTILRHSLHTFTIQMGEREEVVPTSCLKPCQMPHVVSVQPHSCSRGYLPAVLPVQPVHPISTS